MIIKGGILNRVRKVSLATGHQLWQWQFLTNYFSLDAVTSCHYYTWRVKISKQKALTYVQSYEGVVYLIHLKQPVGRRVVPHCGNTSYIKNKNKTKSVNSGELKSCHCIVHGIWHSGLTSSSPWFFTII